jgi:hypothetical protein
MRKAGRKVEGRGEKEKEEKERERQRQTERGCKTGRTEMKTRTVFQIYYLGTTSILLVLACPTVLFHASPPQLSYSNFESSFFPHPLTSSAHLNLGLPILITATGVHSVIIFTVLC